MNLSNLSTALISVVVVLGFSDNRFAYAQNGLNPERLANIRDRLSNVDKVLSNFSEVQRRTLSSGAQNLLTLTQGWNRVEDDVEKISLQIANSAGRGRGTSLDDEGEAPDAVASRVSSSAADFVFSISAGFTQSETSSAWCGSNVVVGFNDSGSFFESMLFGPGGASFSGASFSSSPAGPFHDMGYINPGPDPNNLLTGDPVVTCTKPADGVSAGLTTFYYSQILLTGPPAKRLQLLRFLNPWMAERYGAIQWPQPKRTVLRTS